MLCRVALGTQIVEQRINSEVSLRSKRFRGAKSEELKKKRGFRRFARTKNGARAKIRRRGFLPSPPPPPPSYFCSRPIFRAGKTPKAPFLLRSL